MPLILAFRSLIGNSATQLLLPAVRQSDFERVLVSGKVDP